MKIEIKGKNQTKKDLWVDGCYVGKIDVDHNEVTEKELDYLELHAISYFEITLWAVYNENDE